MKYTLTGILIHTQCTAQCNNVDQIESFQFEQQNECMEIDILKVLLIMCVLVKLMMAENLLMFSVSLYLVGWFDKNAVMLEEWCMVKR